MDRKFDIVSVFEELGLDSKRLEESLNPSSLRQEKDNKLSEPDLQ